MYVGLSEAYIILKQLSSIALPYSRLLVLMISITPTSLKSMKVCI